MTVTRHQPQTTTAGRLSDESYRVLSAGLLLMTMFAVVALVALAAGLGVALGVAHLI